MGSGFAPDSMSQQHWAAHHLRARVLGMQARAARDRVALPLFPVAIRRVDCESCRCQTAQTSAHGVPAAPALLNPRACAPGNMHSSVPSRGAWPLKYQSTNERHRAPWKRGVGCHWTLNHLSTNERHRAPWKRGVGCHWTLNREVPRNSCRPSERRVSPRTKTRIPPVLAGSKRPRTWSRRK